MWRNIDSIVRTMMGAQTPVNDNTTFVYDDGKLILSDEQKETKTEQRRKFSKRQLAEDEYWMMIPAAIQEREYPIFQTVQVYILEKITEWLKMKSDDAKNSSFTSTSTNREFLYKDLAKEVGTSQVLERLISGRPLLPSPPPKSYYHYWYELVDDGEGVCMDVLMSTTKKWVDGKNVDNFIIRIDGEEWNLLKEIEIDGGDNEFILQWKDTDYIYKLSRMTSEDFERMLHPYQRKMVTKDHYSWKLTRVLKGEIDEQH